MKVFLSTCFTVDPDIEYDTGKETILGMFSTKKLAENAFTRKEKRKDKSGKEWEFSHSCFRGSHEIKEFVVDEWYPIGR